MTEGSPETSRALHSFWAQATTRSRGFPDPADCVLALAPLMLDLIENADSFLKPEHFRSSPDGHARNLINAARDESLSLYSLVWLPGQWTPIHDHGSWGVVGVFDGVLEERSYVHLTPDRGCGRRHRAGERRRDSAQSWRSNELRSQSRPYSRHRRAGRASQRAVSLHLYGRTMNKFNTYDLATRTRRQVVVAHNES